MPSSLPRRSAVSVCLDHPSTSGSPLASLGPPASLESHSPSLTRQPGHLSRFKSQSRPPSTPLIPPLPYRSKADVWPLSSWRHPRLPFGPPAQPEVTASSSSTDHHLSLARRTLSTRLSPLNLLNAVQRRLNRLFCSRRLSDSRSSQASRGSRYRMP